MAVYTHISPAELTRHLSRFSIGEVVSCTGIAEGVENSNYKLVTTQGDFILTLFEKRVRAEDLPFHLSFMEHLRGRGIPCAAVLCDREGNKIVPLHQKPSVITSFLTGAGLKQIKAAHTGALGKIVGRMHLAGAGFPMRCVNELSLPAWKRLIDACRGKMPADQYALLQKEVQYQETHWPASLPAGAVHADLFPDNVFFQGEALSGVIDFYFSCTETFVYDLMLTLNAWCFDKAGKCDKERSGALLGAYKKERPLSAAEESALRFFGRAAALRIIATRLYDSLHPVPGALVTPKDPSEYVRILNFHQQESFLS